MIDYHKPRVPLSEFLKKDREVRRSHLDLSQPCVEIGGNSTSFRALLAYHLNTTCEGLGNQVGYLCHACHNGKCSNPYHLYWGDATDNYTDHLENGGKNFREKLLDKHGPNPQCYAEGGKVSGRKNLLRYLQNVTPEERKRNRAKADPKLREAHKKPIIVIHPSGEEELFESSVAACEKYNLQKSKVSAVLNNNRSHHKGLRFQFA